MSRRYVAAGLVGLVILAWHAEGAQARVFHSKESALKVAFPGATSVRSRHFFLTTQQIAAVKKLSGEAPKSKIMTVYVGSSNGKPRGYAFIDTHVVRTLPETFMAVLDATGTVRAVHVLAFHEPTEYLPPTGWLEQFSQRRYTSDLQVNHEIAGVAGATLSAQAITRAMRRILALHRVLIASQATPQK